MIIKHFRTHIYGYCMLALIIAACILRIVMITFQFPTTNSDEAVMGLMAKHIAYQGEFPIFFYGQGYMGALEAYIGAFLFHLLGGPSLFALRLGLIPLYACFMISLYFLARLLYGRKLALFTGLLLSLGSSDIIGRQIKAIGGYPELPIYATLIFLLACKIVFSAPPQKMQGRQKIQQQRLLLYGLLGLMTGLAIWNDPLIVTTILPAYLLILVFCYREVFSWPILCALLGFLIGLSPMIYYNLTLHGDQQSTLASMTGLQSNAAEQIKLSHLNKLAQLSATFFASIPSVTGFNPLCSTNSFPKLGTHTTESLRCIAVQGGWATGYVLLWAIAALMAMIAIWHIWQTNRHQFAQQKRQMHDTVDDRQHVLRLHTARLLLLVSGATTILVYANNPASALNPIINDRYLDNLLIVIPAVLWPLWNGLSKIFVPTTWTHKLSLSLRAICLLLILFLYVNGTRGIIQGIPATQKVYQQQTTLMNNLLHIGATRFYTDYWTCYRLTFESNEKIVCEVLTSGLHISSQVDNRYEPYKAMVAQAPGFTYVLPEGSALAQSMVIRIKQINKSDYKLTILDGFAIYQSKVQLHF